MVVHGAVLRSRFFSTEQVEAIVQDYRHAGLTPAEVAMLAFAEKVTLHAYRITERDWQELRDHGFSDAEILDILLTATGRTFFSKTMDAIGAGPDNAYLTLEPRLREALTVGRAFRQGEYGR